MKYSKPTKKIRKVKITQNLEITQINWGKVLPDLRYLFAHIVPLTKNVLILANNAAVIVFYVTPVMQLIYT